MLTALNVGYPLAPVGRDTAGGAEQVLAQIDAALVAAGHRSVVIGGHGSRARGVTIELPPAIGPLDESVRARSRVRCRAVIAEALSRYPIDLVHLHGVDFFDYLPPPGPPVLVTLHLPLSWYPPDAVRPWRPDTWLHCVSASQRRTAPADLPLLPDIPNGVDVEALSGRHARRRFALALGRICPEKGFHHALAAARAADMPLFLGGEVFAYPEHESYFAREIAPGLDRQRCYLGPVGFARKRRLLNAARCVLVPSLVAETGSLVAMEALACGTPVIAFPNGALADVVEDGVTGYLVEDEEGMAAAMLRAGDIDPQACRQAARTRFAAAHMTQRYLDLYRRLATRRKWVA
jgi:glycosyltransferase involved in cell wall biosynthesis